MTILFMMLNFIRLIMPYFMKTKIPTEYRMEGTFVYPYMFLQLLRQTLINSMCRKNALKILWLQVCRWWVYISLVFHIYVSDIRPMYKISFLHQQLLKWNSLFLGQIQKLWMESEYSEWKLNYKHRWKYPFFYHQKLMQRLEFINICRIMVWKTNKPALDYH